MPIDKSNFKFQAHYTGLWSCINNPKKQFSGTLFIDQQKYGLNYVMSILDKNYLTILIRWMDVLIQLMVQVKKRL